MTFTTKVSPLLISNVGPGNWPFTVMALCVLHSLFTGVASTYSTTTSKEVIILRERSKKEEDFSPKKEEKKSERREHIQQTHAREFLHLLQTMLKLREGKWWLRRWRSSGCREWSSLGE